MIEKRPDEYFEKLGEPKPSAPFNALDFYRFYNAYNFLLLGSVLEVGTYLGDFLKIVQKEDPNREIYGTDVNKERVYISNKNLGKSVVRVDFRDGLFTTFKDNSVDNIVCTEVIEHISNDKLAVKELCRVARKRVIITVPYKEKITSHLCIHCGQYTPSCGHLHSYQLNSFDKMLPAGWIITKRGTFGHVISSILASKLNNIYAVKISEAIFTKIFSESNRWMYLILDSIDNQKRIRRETK